MTEPRKVQVMRTFLLDESETGLLKGLLRKEIGNAWRLHEHSQRKFGATYKEERALNRIDYLERTFRKLGGKLEDHIVRGSE